MACIATSYGSGHYRAGEKSVVVTRRMHQPDGARRGVLFVTGAGSDASAYFDSPSGGNAYAGAGLPVMFGDFGASLTTFGNDDAMTAIDAGWTWAKLTAHPSPGFKTDKVIFQGGSQGALEALRWARANPTLIAVLILAIPVLDLNDMYQNNKGGYRAAIGTAHGVTYPTAIPNLALKSPVAFSSGDKAAMTFPIYIWASDDDVVASNTAACQAWAATMPDCTVFSLGAQGHVDSGGVPGIVGDRLAVALAAA